MTRSRSHTETTVGFDPFAAGTRSDLFELMQETTPLDAAALARLVPARPATPRTRESSRRLRRESGRQRRAGQSGRQRRESGALS